MSKAVLICSKNISRKQFSKRDFEILSKRLSPDNISPNPPLVVENTGVMLGIFNPVGEMLLTHGGACLGRFIGPVGNWAEPGAAIPDGSFALFRSNEKTIELATDVLASRTIWYVKLDDVFIAATSQRAIVFFLKSFKPNRSVFPWVLSSGTLGPGLSWDKRIQCLKGNSRLIINRSSWTMGIKSEPILFSPINLSQKEHEARLEKALKYSFENLQISDYGKWLLPLSGGYDSRAIFLYLKEKKNLKTITWGLKSSLNDKNNDAFVAKSLAQLYGVEHEYFETDISNEFVEAIFNRFLMAGEGRIDHISAYMDGFKIWKHIFENKYHGVIRGDEAFGCKAVRYPSEVFKNMSVRVMADYTNLAPLLSYFEVGDQSIPDELHKQNDETIEMWRDRLNADFETPVLFAALNDLKLSYTEVIDPLLSRKIIETVRTLPDDLRTDKRLFKRIAAGLEPRINFAKHPAIAARGDVLKTQKVVKVVTECLRISYDKNILPKALFDYVLTAYSNQKNFNQNRFLREVLKISRKIRKRLKIDHLDTILDPNILGFRVYVICKMMEILEADANGLKSMPFP